MNLIIIGAGAAGLAAASRLIERGFNPAKITILEAENRIGGRIFTVPYGSSVIEIGAQWVHGNEDNPVYPLAAEAGETWNEIFTLESTGHADDVNMAYTDGRKISSAQLKEFKHILERIYNDSERELPNWKKSLGEYYENKYGELLDQGLLTTMDRMTAMYLLDWVQRAQNIEDGADDWKETYGVTSLKYFLEERYTTVWKRGYSVLFDILMKNVPKIDNGLKLSLSDRIHLNSPVKLIRWNSDQVQVVCSEKTYYADMVLVTCSLGVLKDRADKLFTPRLPEKKRKAIEALGFGTVNKIFLEFRKPWWTSEWGGVNFINDPSKSTGEWEDRILGFFTLRGQPNILIGWVTGSASRQFENSSETEVLLKCSALLKKAVGTDFAYENPTRIIRSLWHSNPHFCGSYSYRSKRSMELDVCPSDLAEPVTDSNGDIKLLFAGEATHEYRYSTVDAAVATGWREADRIVEFGKKTNFTAKL